MYFLLKKKDIYNNDYLIDIDESTFFSFVLKSEEHTDFVDELFFKAESKDIKLDSIPSQNSILAFISFYDYIEKIKIIYNIKIDNIILNKVLELLEIDVEKIKIISECDILIKKKLSLLREFFIKPQILILDNFYDGLDSLQKREINRILRIMLINNITIINVTKEFEIFQECMSDEYYKMYQNVVVKYKNRKFGSSFRLIS